MAGGTQQSGATDEQALVRAALGGDPAAMRDLVLLLVPVLRVRVGRALLRSRYLARGRDWRQEAEDMVQEIFAILLSDGGAVLRTWDPARGLQLKGFVGLVAEREVASILRSGRRSPFTEDPTLDENLFALAEPGAGELRALESRQILARLLDRMRERLSPLGLRLFELLYIEERAVEEVAMALAMNRDAIYAWRSRLARLARELAADLTTTPLHASAQAEKSVS